MKIGYLTFGRDDFGYGLALCLSKLKGHELYRVSPRTAKLVDVLLFSCFSWEHAYCVAQFLRLAGIRKSCAGRPKVVIGGFNTFNPVPFRAYADEVVCGDGEGWIERIISGESARDVWNNVSALSGFYDDTSRIARMEISRGCKFSCKFCGVGNLKPYREVDIEAIREFLSTTRKKQVSLFGPEPNLHSAREEVDYLCHRYGKTRVDTDQRLDNLGNRNSGARPNIGIEGISEKLRKACGKPYSDQKIIDSIELSISQGRGGLLFYLILGLPGETLDDWESLKSLMEKVSRVKTHGNKFTLTLHPTSFMPIPHVPMEMEGVNWDEDYGSRWVSMFSDLPQGDISVLGKRSFHKPSMRVLSMVSVRGGEEFHSIEEDLSRSGAIKADTEGVTCENLHKLLKVLDGHGGVEHYCGPRTAKSVNPWKVVKFQGDE